MATASQLVIDVGPEVWKNASIDTIKIAQTLINKGEDNVDEGKCTNPLPLLRDACVRESNRRIHAHARATRAVVVKVRQSLVMTNEEIKSLNRMRHALEKALDFQRKDIALNAECSLIRQERPRREKDPLDGADDMLSRERDQLLHHKRCLESHLKKVLEQLQVLGSIRSQLGAVVQERSRVTELICHSVGSAYYFARTEALSNSRGRHTKTLSAPPVFLGKGEELTVDQDTVGFLEPLTPAALKALQTANEAREKSQETQRAAQAMMDTIRQVQQSTHSAVSQGLTQKIAESVTLMQHLDVNAGETKLSFNKSHRHLKQQEKALGYLLGPVSSSDITTREHLDRPLVRVYQQHPGTDLPEADHLIQAGSMYNDSIAITRRNLALLKLARKQLMEDSRGKKSAIELDSGVVRLRRRKQNHRWVLEGNTMPLLQPVVPVRK